MDTKRAFATQSFLLTLVLNALLVGIVYALGRDALAGQAVAVFGLGLLVTLALWFVLQQLARKLAAGGGAPPPRRLSGPPPPPARRPRRQHPRIRR
jgi:hypothetical protein